MNKNAKIYIAGYRGMVGSSILSKLKSEGFKNLVLRTRKELDLTRQKETEDFFCNEQPEYVFLAAARVGGIMANNTYRAEFIYENLMIQSNVIHAAWKYGVKKLLFLGSSCIYPKLAPQPLREEYLLTGPLEYTNEPYAIAKIAGIKMCENYYRQYGANFISVMPTNLYGPNDNYNLETSHVLPAFIRKMHLGKCLENNDWDAIRQDLNKNPIEGTDGRAPEDVILQNLNKYGINIQSIGKGKKVIITLWGTGKVFREFLHVNDMADACVHIMRNVDASLLYEELQQTHINIGTGQDITLMELAALVKKITAFKGELLWDHLKPEGTPKKQMQVDVLHSLGWKHKIPLREGIEKNYKFYENES